MTTIERIAFLTRIKRELNDYIQKTEIKDAAAEFLGGESVVIKTIESCILTLQKKLTS